MFDEANKQTKVGSPKDPTTNPSKGTKASADDKKTYKNGKDAKSTTDAVGAPGGLYPGASKVIPDFGKVVGKKNVPSGKPKMKK